MAYPVQLFPSAETPSTPTVGINLVGALSRVNAEQIERIGLQIVNMISLHLGIQPSVNVFNAILEKKGASATSQDKSKARLLNLGLELTIKEKQPVVFSEEELGKLRESMAGHVRQAITLLFSTPTKFLSEGAKFTRSEQGPCGMLENAARETGIAIEEYHVPSSFQISLRLSPESKELLFYLTASSDGIEFEQKKFALEQV